MTEIGGSLQQLLSALLDLALVFAGLIVPWVPLFAWIVFWTFAVNWTRLYEIIRRKGGIVGVVLVGLVAILVWGSIAPPPQGRHFMPGLSVSNYVGKTVYVTMLTCIMFLCGSLQLSGCCSQCCSFDDDAAPSDAAHPGGSGETESQSDA